MNKKIWIVGVLAGTAIGVSLIAVSGSKNPLAKQEAIPVIRVKSPIIEPPVAVVEKTAIAEVKIPKFAESEIWRSFSRQQDLEHYAHLRRKVFLSNAETALRRRLIQDRGLLLSLRPLLLTEVPQDKVPMQNAALDYVFEALKSGDKEGAREVLQSVVQSAAVEEVTGDLRTRKSLGGVKAEVLFQWSSMDDEAASLIEKSLPGPISRKIWVRVQEQQENNLAESTTLQAQR